MEKQVTFKTLDPTAQIFTELKSCNYLWWERIKEDPQLYVEVRKNNEIHVYFEGGRVVRLRYCSKHKKLQALTHEKYLSGDGDKYVNCIDKLDGSIDHIIKNIKCKYSEKNGVTKEKWSEKFIQGHLIINNRTKYLDSEFAYKDGTRDIRIDLLECINGGVSCVELKRIDDARMLKKDDSDPEIISQMNEYREFITHYSSEILAYYQKVYEIKKALRLPIPNQAPTHINENPLLLIFNRWDKTNKRREERTKRIEEILHGQVMYSIINQF